ncbi:MAG: MFS transporter, partial [Candidatus Moranbacteria bacterium]|nr:MFS transporter [Candidatus Moranbacteria bacterium]
MWSLFKKKQKLNQSQTRLLYGTAFFLGLCGSLILYTASTYFSEVWGTENVGFVYACIFASNLAFLFFLHSIIFFFGKTMMFYILLFTQILCVFFVSLLDISFFGAIFLMISSLTLSLLWTILDSILEDFSLDEFSGRIRGTYLATMNAGLLLGPLLSAVLIDSYGYSGLYCMALLFFVILFSISLGVFYGTNYKIRTYISLSKIVSRIKKHPDLLYIYWISFTLDFFYAILIVFTTIYFLQLGLSWS